MLLNLDPVELTEADWDEIFGAFAPGSIFMPTLEKLRAADNRPTMAKDLFTGSLVNQGHEQVNAVLREAGLRFRLTLIGPWKKFERETRTLAIVKLTDELVARMKRAGK